MLLLDPVMNKSLTMFQELHFVMAQEPREVQQYLIKSGKGKVPVANGHRIKWEHKNRTAEVKGRPIETQILRNKVISCTEL